jgi:predicted small secreted protein
MTRLAIKLRRSTRLLRNTMVLGILGLLLLAGCHTTAGFGQDMQSVGRNIQNSANKNNK